MTNMINGLKGGEEMAVGKNRQREKVRKSEREVWSLEDNLLEGQLRSIQEATPD